MPTPDVQAASDRARISMSETMENFRETMRITGDAHRAKLARIRAEGLLAIRTACTDPPSAAVLARMKEEAEAREMAEQLSTRNMPLHYEPVECPPPPWHLRLRGFFRKLLPLVLVGVITTVMTSNANDALNFVNSNWASSSPARETGPQRADRGTVKAVIKAANARAAERHGVPVAFMDRLTMRESGYRFVQGPPTKWGRAQGPHQILCGTARELGERDCSRLMRDAERSADLAARYVRQGYDATGSWHGAAAYYHGGPDKRIWGKKTRAYAAAVAPARVADVAALFNTRRVWAEAPVQSGFVVAYASDGLR